MDPDENLPVLPDRTVATGRLRASSAALLLGGLALAVGPLFALLVLQEPGLHWFAQMVLLGAALFAGGGLGLLTVFWTREALSAGPRLVLDEEGLTDRFLPETVRWEEIRTAFELEKENQPFLFLELADPEEFCRRVPWWRRALPPFTAGPFQGKYLVVMLTGLEIDPRALEAEIRARVMLAGGGDLPALEDGKTGAEESGAEEAEATREEVEELGGKTF